MFNKIAVAEWAYANRDFAVWAVSPSKQQLLLRSPLNANREGDRNIDVLFYGVSQMFIRPHLPKLRLKLEAGGARGAATFDAPLNKSSVRFLLVADGFNGFVDAMDSLYVEENTYEPWDSSVEFLVRGARS